MKIRISVSEEKFDLVSKYLTGHGVEISEDAEYVLSEASRYPAFLTVRDDKKDRMRLAAAEVIYVEAFGKEIEIHAAQGTYYALDRMYQLESLLDPQEFLRISKSVIISRKHVKKIRASLSMKYVLTLSDGTLVDVTRSYYNDFRKFFAI
ncbi:MAG: LytTR family transcriptional regulator [Lachnospiraceae bacterium]|nr:LytTR family transcriptional regulator [Lachnospiraceae bacterium]MBQ3905592.1 LytTR family transcriptional regulator [Lachnospiraceae bacterium]